MVLQKVQDPPKASLALLLPVGSVVTGEGGGDGVIEQGAHLFRRLHITATDTTLQYVPKVGERSRPLLS